MVARRIRIGTPGPSYTGPGDVVGSATGFWGLRAYNAAYATGSNPCVDLVDQAGANNATFNINSSGSLDIGGPSGVAAWVAAHSVTTIRVGKLYDQVGTKHLTNGSGVAFYPELVLSSIGSLPGINFPGADRQLGNASFTQAQPFTASIILNQDSTGGTGRSFLANANEIECDRTTAGNIQMYAGAAVTQSLTEDTPHALQLVFNSTSSSIERDGTSTGFNDDAGTGEWNAEQLSLAAYDTSSFFWKGSIYELGIWPVAFNGTQVSNMNSNQHTYWGF